MARIPDFKLPSAATLNKEIDSQLDGFLTSVMSQCKSRPFSLSLDISTTKSMAASFLGITVQCLNKNFKNVCFALAIEQLEGSHTHELIRSVTETVLSKYGIGLDQVTAFVTDSGANILKAFRFVLFNLILNFSLSTLSRTQHIDRRTRTGNR